MLTGMGARRQPLMLIITTAGANIEGPCYDKRRQVIEMLEGTVPDEELFGWILTLDEGDDWTDPKMLAKANPNHGRVGVQEYLESQQAKGDPLGALHQHIQNQALERVGQRKIRLLQHGRLDAPAKTPTLTDEQFEGQ